MRTHLLIFLSHQQSAAQVRRFACPRFWDLGHFPLGNVVDGAPDAKALREIRKILDEPAFLAELTEYLKQANDPDVKAKILSDIIDISRLCSDKAAERKNQLTNLRYGIGGGAAMAGGGLIGLFAAGPALLIVIGAGLWIGGMSIGHTSKFAEEEQIYTDIAARAGKIRDKFDAT